jgi:hypothetical protein
MMMVKVERKMKRIRENNNLELSVMHMKNELMN